MKRINNIVLSRVEPDKNVIWLFPLPDGTYSCRVWMLSGWVPLIPDGSIQQMFNLINSTTTYIKSFDNRVLNAEKNISNNSSSIEFIKKEIKEILEDVNKLLSTSYYKITKDNDYYYFHKRQYDENGEQIEDSVFKIDIPKEKIYEIIETSTQLNKEYKLVCENTQYGASIIIPKNQESYPFKAKEEILANGDKKYTIVEDRTGEVENKPIIIEKHPKVPTYSIRKDENNEKYYLVKTTDGASEDIQVPIELSKDFLLKDAYIVSFDENGNEFKINDDGSAVATGVINKNKANNKYLKFIIKTDDSDGIEKPPIYIKIDDLAVSLYNSGSHISIDDNNTIKSFNFIPQYEDLSNALEEEGIVQYVGPTTDDLIQFYFYRRVGLEWIQTDVQPQPNSNKQYFASANIAASIVSPNSWDFDPTTKDLYKNVSYINLCKENDVQQAPPITVNSIKLYGENGIEVRVVNGNVCITNTSLGNSKNVLTSSSKSTVNNQCTSNPYINSVVDNKATSSIKIIGSNGIKTSSSINGELTILGATTDLIVSNYPNSTSKVTNTSTPHLNFIYDNLCKFSLPIVGEGLNSVKLSNGKLIISSPIIGKGYIYSNGSPNNGSGEMFVNGTKTTLTVKNDKGTGYYYTDIPLDYANRIICSYNSKESEHGGSGISINVGLKTDSSGVKRLTFRTWNGNHNNVEFNGYISFIIINY